MEIFNWLKEKYHVLLYLVLFCIVLHIIPVIVYCRLPERYCTPYLQLSFADIAWLHCISFFTVAIITAIVIGAGTVLLLLLTRKKGRDANRSV